MSEVAEFEERVADEDPVTCHRAGNYVELGFGVEDAFGLAKTKDSKGFYIYWGNVKKMLDQGASHSQVVACFI